MKFDTRGTKLFTSGEWRIVSHKKSNNPKDAFLPFLCIQNDEGRRVCTIANAIPDKVSPGEFLEANANAILIVHAPMLLDECYYAANLLKEILAGGASVKLIESEISELESLVNAAKGDDFKFLPHPEEEAAKQNKQQ